MNRNIVDTEHSEIGKLQVEYNNMTLTQKKQFILSLKEELKVTRTPEKVKFLTNCILSYNSEISNIKNKLNYDISSQNEDDVTVKKGVVIFVIVAILIIIVIGMIVNKLIYNYNIDKIVGGWEYTYQNNENTEYITSGYKIYEKYEFREDGTFQRNSTSYVYLENSNGYNSETKIEISTGNFIIRRNRLIINLETNVISSVKTENGVETSREMRNSNRSYVYEYKIDNDQLILKRDDISQKIYEKVEH